MEFRKLGRNGPEVSIVGIGCNNFGSRLDRDGTRRVVDRAIERGVTLFDTANSYGGGGESERLLGEVLGPRRKEIVLATKFGLPTGDGPDDHGASRCHIVRAVEDSLKRLKTDWIDLYQTHRPDPATPQEETLRALDDLVRQGKVRYIGCSNHSAGSVGEALEISARNGLAAYVCCQDEYNLLDRDLERDLLPLIETNGLGLLPYRPLAGGFLTNKFHRGAALPPNTRLAQATRLQRTYLTDRNWDLHEDLSEFTAKRGRELVDLAFAWLISHPAVSSVIAGAMTPEQVDRNVAAAEWDLSVEDLAAGDGLLANNTASA